MWYTIAVRTTPGAGDYGSDYRTMADRPMPRGAMERAVHVLETTGHEVSVFRGKHRGVLAYHTTTDKMAEEVSNEQTDQKHVDGT